MDKVTNNSKIVEKKVKVRKKNYKNGFNCVNENVFHIFEKNKLQVQNITTNKLTFQAKSLDFTVNFLDNIKSGLNKLNDEPKNFLEPVVEQSSIFREIEEKYQFLIDSSPPKSIPNKPCFVNDEKIKQLLEKKLSDEENSIVDSSSCILNQFLQFNQSEDLEKSFLNSIVANQNKINYSCVLFELKVKFRSVPLPETCLRRKFVRKCNKLIKLQKLEDKVIEISEAEQLIRSVELKTDLMHFEMNSVQEICPSPNNISNFPETSYRTPENQRFLCRNPESSKFLPAIFSNQAPYIIHVNQDVCKDNSLLSEFGVPQELQSHLMVEAEKYINTINIRDKHSTMRKKRTISKVRSLDMTPYRKLFDEKNENSGNFDFQPLDSILPKKHSKMCVLPHEFDQNPIACEISNDFSPNEYQLRRKYAPDTLQEMQGACSNPKNIKIANEDLVQIPQAPPTPNVQCFPRFQF